MIIPMTRYSFILMSGEQEGFLARLQELGVVDITRSVKPIDTESSEMLVSSETLRKQISELDQDEPVSDRLKSLEAELTAILKEQKARQVWGEFDPKTLSALATDGLKVRFYSVSPKTFRSEWAQLQPLSIISEDKDAVWFVTVSDDPDYTFPVPQATAPAGPASDLQGKIDEINASIEAEKARLQELKSKLPELEQQYSRSLANLDRYLAGKASVKAADNHISVFTGFAPKENEASLKEAFDGMDVFYIAEDAVKQDKPPIKLRNNRFVKNFEVLTDMYGRPEYDEFDPTPYISIFFLLFFAFCMGDMGYGLVLVAGSFLLKKVKSFAGYSTLVLYLGLATTVIGFLFHTFFSMDIIEWNCIPDGLKNIMLPSKIIGYDGTMVLSIIVGIIHLCVAKIVSAVWATRKTSFKESLGVWGWTLLIVGGTIVGGLALIGALNGAVTKWIVIIIGVVSAIGIFPLNNIHRNVFANIGLGLYDTYSNATGILSDVLSYLRLYALGLAGMYLGVAFNSLGTMILGDGSSIALWIPFVLIVLIGHVLNIAMAALGAFVHPLRLNFLEFFKNSGYEGTGRFYNPLTNNNNK